MTGRSRRVELGELVLRARLQIKYWIFFFSKQTKLGLCAGSVGRAAAPADSWVGRGAVESVAVRRLRLRRLRLKSVASVAVASLSSSLRIPKRRTAQQTPAHAKSSSVSDIAQQQRGTASAVSLGVPTTPDEYHYWTSTVHFVQYRSDQYCCAKTVPDMS
eukprot:1888905-Rhodomonas_salina.1